MNTLHYLIGGPAAGPYMHAPPPHALPPAALPSPPHAPPPPPANEEPGMGVIYLTCYMGIKFCKQ